MNYDPYTDIRHLPCPTPRTRPRMSRRDRAAQFAPFAALTGFEEQIDDTAKNQQKQAEHEIEWIDMALCYPQ